MSQHSSLKSSTVGKKIRTVLKRYERFFALKEKGVLDDSSSVFGMPKLKIVRTKIRKEKAEEKPEEVQAAAPEAEGAKPKDAQSKAAKGEKTATAKGAK